MVDYFYLLVAYKSSYTKSQHGWRSGVIYDVHPLSEELLELLVINDYW